LNQIGQIELPYFDPLFLPKTTKALPTEKRVILEMWVDPIIKPEKQEKTLPDLFVGFVHQRNFLFELSVARHVQILNFQGLILKVNNLYIQQKNSFILFFCEFGVENDPPF
jgi:hypothetical protein